MQRPKKEDSDSGSSSDSSAKFVIGGYDHFINSIELSESDDQRSDTDKNPKKTKAKKKIKSPRHSPHYSPHRKAKKIIMPDVERALGEDTIESEYLTENPAEYEDPDLYDNHEEEKPYTGLTDSSRKALLKLKQMEVLGGSPVARQSSGYKTPSQKTPSQKTPHQKTPSQKTPHQKTPSQKTPGRKINMHLTPFTQPEELTSEYIDSTADQPDQPDQQDWEPPKRPDTDGAYSIGGHTHMPSHKTPSHKTPSHKTPSHKTPSHKTPTHTPSHKTPTRNYTPIIYEISKHDTPASPYISTVDHQYEQQDDHQYEQQDEQPDINSPVKSEYDDLDNLDNPRQDSNASTPRNSPRVQMKNYTGGFGNAIAMFGGAW